MKLTLTKTNGKEKVYFMPRPKMKVMRDLTKLTKLANEGSLDIYDQIEQFICDAFGNQFGAEDLEECLYLDEINELLDAVSAEIMAFASNEEEKAERRNFIIGAQK